LHGQSDEGPLAADLGGVPRELGEVQFDADDQLDLLGDDLGLGQGDLESAPGQAGAFARSSFNAPQLPISILSPGHGSDGPDRCLSHGSASPQTEGEVYSVKPQLRILFGEGSSEEGDAEARHDLLWMTQLQLLHCHGHLWPLTEDCAIEVQTDASDQGFGIWFGVTSTAGGGTASTFGDISMPGMEYFNVTLCF
jgi:hypothetical protein